MVKPGPVFLPWMQPMLAEVVRETVTDNGVGLYAGHPVEAIEHGGDGLRVRVSVGGDEETVLDKVRKAVKARARILPDHLETAPQEEITRLWYSEDTRKPRKFRDLRQR